MASRATSVRTESVTGWPAYDRSRGRLYAPMKRNGRSEFLRCSRYIRSPCPLELRPAFLLDIFSRD